MQDLLTALYEYVENHSTEPDPLLIHIGRETHLKTLAPRMLSGHLQGNILSILSMILRPNNILEIGTFTGYSAICLAKGLSQTGTLTTIEFDREIAEIAYQHFNTSPYSDKVILKIGDAKEIIPTLDQVFDLVFIDADKESYSQYYDLIFDKCRAGAIIIVDNVLWSGKVLDTEMDKKTQSIDAFNKKITSDNRVFQVILPVRDGLNLIVKK